MEPISKLSEEQKARFLEHWNNKWPNKNCSICGVMNWNIIDRLVNLTSFVDRSNFLGQLMLFPQILMTCQNCGHSILISAKSVGLLDDPSPLNKEIC